MPEITTVEEEDAPLILLADGGECVDSICRCATAGSWQGSQTRNINLCGIKYGNYSMRN